MGGRKKGSFLSYVAARAIVEKLGLKSEKEWREWCKAGQRPSNIPATPSQTYRDDGWISVPDWLGYEGPVTSGSMLPFLAARVIVRKVMLKSKKEWKALCKSDQRPTNIPSNPDRTYRDDGWVSWPDWLGKEGGYGAMLPFLAARAIVREFKLKNQQEWREWCKSGQRPSNIPSLPSKTYRNDGWISVPDWLGWRPGGRHKWSQRVRDGDEKEDAAMQSLSAPERIRRIASRVAAEVAGRRAEREERPRRHGGDQHIDGGDDSSNGSGSDGGNGDDGDIDDPYFDDDLPSPGSTQRRQTETDLARALGVGRSTTQTLVRRGVINPVQRQKRRKAWEIKHMKSATAFARQLSKNLAGKSLVRTSRRTRSRHTKLTGENVGKAWGEVAAFTSKGLAPQDTDIDAVDAMVPTSYTALRAVVSGDRLHMDVNARLKGMSHVEKGSACTATFPNLVLPPKEASRLRSNVGRYIRNAFPAAKGSAFVFSGRRPPVPLKDLAAALKASDIAEVRVVEMGGEMDIVDSLPRLAVFSTDTASQVDMSRSYYLDRTATGNDAMAGRKYNPYVHVFGRGEFGTGLTALAIFQTLAVLKESPEVLHAGMVKVNRTTIQTMLEFLGIELPHDFMINDIVLYVHRE